MSKYTPPVFNVGDKASLWQGDERLGSVRITDAKYVTGLLGNGKWYTGWAYQTDRTGNQFLPETMLRIRPQPASTSFTNLMQEMTS